MVAYLDPVVCIVFLDRRFISVLFLGKPSANPLKDSQAAIDKAKYCFTGADFSHGSGNEISGIWNYREHQLHMFDSPHAVSRPFGTLCSLNSQHHLSWLELGLLWTTLREAE
jgi:hypothetical protein